MATKLRSKVSCFIIELSSSLTSIKSDPNVSDQAKRHAREVLNANAEEFSPGSEYVSDADYFTERGSGMRGRGHDASENRVLGGYKATVHSKLSFPAKCVKLTRT